MSEFEAVVETVRAGLKIGKTPLYENRVLSVTDDIEREHICRETGLPFLPLIVPEWNSAAFLQEVARAFENRRAEVTQDGPGQAKKLMLFDCERADNKLLSQCPQISRWLEGLIQQQYYSELHRVQAVLLEPDSFIPFRRERPEEIRALWPMNLALNASDQVYWVFKDFGAVPFYNGGVYGTDISYEYGVLNGGAESRFHLIIHGDCHEGYAQAVRRSILRSKLILRNEAAPSVTQPLPEPNRKVRFAFWRGFGANVPVALQEICESISTHFLRLRSQALAPTLVDYSASRILYEAEISGAEWCVVMVPGRIFKMDFVEEFFETLEKTDSKTVAYTLPGGDLSILAVNIRAWRSLGSPAINKEFAGKASGAGYRVRTFTGNIIEQSLFLHPEEVPSEILQSVRALHVTERLSQEQRECIRYLEVESGVRGNKVYPYNTESYLDVLRREDKRPLDGLISVAAGLKDLFALKHHGFHKQTQLVYFDICPEALEYKKYLFRNWSGKNYPDFVREADAAGLPQFAGAKFVNTNLEIMKEWEREILYWDGERNIEEIFLRARDLKMEFMELDIVRFPERLAQWLESVPDGGNYALWFSNCFNYTPTLAQNGWSLPFIAQQGLRLLQEMQSVAQRKHIEIELYGEDVFLGVRSSFTQRKLSEVFA